MKKKNFEKKVNLSVTVSLSIKLHTLKDLLMHIFPKRKTCVKKFYRR